MKLLLVFNIAGRSVARSSTTAAIKAIENYDRKSNRNELPNQSRTNSKPTFSNNNRIAKTPNVVSSLLPTIAKFNVFIATHGSMGVQFEVGCTHAGHTTNEQNNCCGGCQQNNQHFIMTVTKINHPSRT